MLILLLVPIFQFLLFPAFSEQGTPCNPAGVQRLIAAVEERLSRLINPKEESGAFFDVPEVARRLKENPNLNANDIYHEMHLREQDPSFPSIPTEDPYLHLPYAHIKSPDDKIKFQNAMMAHADFMAYQFGLKAEGENHFIKDFIGEGPRGGFRDASGKIAMEYRQYADGPSWFTGNLKREAPANGHFTVYLGVPLDKMAQELPEILMEAQTSAFSFKICGTHCNRKDRLIFYFASEEEAKKFAMVMDEKFSQKGYPPSTPRFAQKMGKGHVGLGSVRPGDMSHTIKVSNVLMEAAQKCGAKNKECIRAVFNSYGIDPKTYGDLRPSK